MSRWPLDPGFRRDDEQQSGATTAITGLILNYLSVLLMVLGICFMILVFGGALAFLGLNADEFQQMLTPMP